MNEQGSSQVRDSSAGSDKSDQQNTACAMRDGGGERTRTPRNIKLNKDNDHQHEVTIKQGKRVKLNPSTRLRKYLEFDNHMIVNCGAQHAMPAAMSIVEILEDFVKLRSVELALKSAMETNSSLRQRSTTQNKEKIKSENIRVMSIVNLLKEFVDGVRIYFIFLLEECLLYEQECDYMQHYISKEYLSKMPRKSSISTSDTSSNSSRSKSCKGRRDISTELHRYLTIIDKTSNASYGAVAVSENMHRYLEEIFNWQMLPDEVESEVSMIFGATHLARLLVKLPDYLSASPMTDDKLNKLIEHLNSLINYVESHEEWFSEKNYIGYDVQQEPKAEKPQQLNSDVDLMDVDKEDELPAVT